MCVILIIFLTTLIVRLAVFFIEFITTFQSFHSMLPTAFVLKCSIRSHAETNSDCIKAVSTLALVR